VGVIIYFPEQVSQTVTLETLHRPGEIHSALLVADIFDLHDINRESAASRAL
jgi:hypothetical protein